MPMTEAQRERQRGYNRTHYAKHKAKVVSSVRDRKRRLAAQVDELKSAPCTDCGRSFPTVCMDFDHIGDDKILNVRAAIDNGWSFKRILAEIAKCELVCSNCHRIRTASRR